MTKNTFKSATQIAIITGLLAISACGLPRTGPTRSEIFAGSVQKQGDAFIVPVDRNVTDVSATRPALGFSAGFRNVAPIGSDTINPGDMLGLTIWENVDESLLANRTMNFSNLEQVQVDGTGYIFVPYA